MATYTREDVLSWRGRDLVDNDGDKVGSIDDIYLDRETGQYWAEYGYEAGHSQWTEIAPVRPPD